MSQDRVRDPADLRNERLTESAFREERETVLAEHPYGETIDLEEGAAFHHDHMADRNVARLLREAEAADDVLVQIMYGRTTPELHGEGWERAEAAGADILPTQVDSLTRTKDWAGTKEGIKQTRETGRSELNGFPIVTHGVETTREMVQRVDTPIELRATSTDLRLVAEVAFASGHSAFTNNPLYAGTNYNKDVPMWQVIRNWMYLYRLVSAYEERGVPITIDCKPVLGGAPTPPSLNVATMVLDLLLMAEQGVKNVAWVNRTQGNIVQAAATARVMDRLGPEYLANAGHDNVRLYHNSSHWNGIWPEDEPPAWAVMNLNTAEALLAGANEIYIKTAVEGKGLPEVEDSLRAIRATRKAIDVLSHQRLPDNDRVAAEADRIERTARAIVDRVFDLGDGDLVQGDLAAIEAGVIDMPFPSSNELAGDVLSMRDRENAVRYHDPGAIPVPDDVLAYHKERLAERSAADDVDLDYDTIVADIKMFT
ncbi:MAG: hypothetical protein ABEH64_11225 [Salinirussus sp.]